VTLAGNTHEKILEPLQVLIICKLLPDLFQPRHPRRSKCPRCIERQRSFARRLCETSLRLLHHLSLHLRLWRTRNADEIQAELRKTIETGIQENLLELALRGKPQAPFYMVGRMDGQSVVLRAEKGKLKLSVSDQQNNEQELTYDLNQNNEQRKEGTEKANQSAGLPGPGQSAGRVGSVDGTVQTGGSLPPVEHQLDYVQPLATPGDGGDAASLGKSGQSDQGRSLEPTPTVTKFTSRLDQINKLANPASTPAKTE